MTFRPNPRLAARIADKFRHRASVGSISPTGDFVPHADHSDLKADYATGSRGSGIQGMVSESPSPDVVILLGAYPTLEANQFVEVTWPSGSPTKRFRISKPAVDSAEITTVLTVGPEE